MKAIKKFISQFTENKIEGIEKIGQRYFLAGEEQLKISEKINRDVFSVGIFLGEKKKDFKPSSGLIEMIAKLSDKKAYINKQSEWLFLCGRDVFEDSIVKSNVERGIVLVQNEADENLGYGELFTKGKKKGIKHYLDRGEYLRREN